MTNQEISELISLFDHSSAGTMKLAIGDFSLELSRETPAASTPPLASPAPAASDAKRNANSGKTIKAPLVGTFYAASAQDKPPYVQPGDHVSKGQTLCLIEAMKMMSEVTAPCDCVIEEILVENGALLSYDAPIFRYREA